MSKVLKKESLRAWVAELGSDDVHAPRLADDIWVYAPVGDDAEVRLDHANTARPPKGFVFPQREILYTFEQDRGAAPTLTETIPNPNPTVVLGVRPCDGRANPRNDTVFTKEFEDPYYHARRKKVAFVGLACNTPPSASCFCKAVGGSPCSEDGLDILLTDLGDRYFVKPLSARGEELVAQAGALAAPAGHEDQAEVELVHAAALAQPQKTFGNLSVVTRALTDNFDSPLWNEMAQPCISCGICTFQCPTCHCFDISDEVSSRSPCRGQRVRTWDNCQFPDFTLHSSGHNPRDDLGARLRQRINHKFLYFVENHGTQQCTGCGRCSSQCPVGIDIVAVLERVGQP